MSALWPSRWPAEDGGPARRQAVLDGAGLAIAPGERLVVAARRDAFATTMVVLREPGEVYVLRHTIGRRPRRDPTSCWVERIDPLTLEPIARSQTLAGGPFWPGGLAAHGNGSLVIVYGQHCHRLSAELELLASRRLPQPRPYNSFVVLGDGTLAMKDIDLASRVPARLSLLDPETLEPRCLEVPLPEAAIGRLAADGDVLYAVGATTAWRYRWDGAQLERDETWSAPYHDGDGHSYAWDPVIAGGQLWFLDNGDHGYSITMRGTGRAAGAVRLHRFSLEDSQDHEAVEVCGLPHGTITDPPLYDAVRRIAIAYDSGNGVVRAFRFEGGLTPLWERRLSHAAHMLHFPDSGELVLHDFHVPPAAAAAPIRALGRRYATPARLRLGRRVAASYSRDEVVVVDIETGAERGRAAVPSMFQSVLFPAPGFGRDLYWCTFSTLARLEVR